MKSSKSGGIDNADFPRVMEVRSILGESTLLLHWPFGLKGTKRKWGHLTLAAMADEKYLRKLESGNIGAALGNKSDRLCAVDLDRDELCEPFLALNPWAQNTTQIRARRGCKFLVRIRGDYPGIFHLFQCENGKKVDAAQWLADHAQVIVSGRHPDGMDYVFENPAQPVDVEYSAIVWPDGLTTSREKRDFTEQKKQRSNGAKGHSELPSTGAGEQPSNTALDAVTRALVCAAVDAALPKRTHQNNSLLFQLARSMRDIERKLGRSLSANELKAVFQLWEKDARPFWRESQSRDEYWFEFWDACDRARFGLEENPLPLVWEAATHESNPPQAIAAVEDPRLRFVISFCGQMQLLSRERPFFIPTRWLAAQFGVSHSQAALWLRGLRLLGILDPATPGTKTRCPRYFYTPLAHRSATGDAAES